MRARENPKQFKIFPIDVMHSLIHTYVANKWFLSSHAFKMFVLLLKYNNESKWCFLGMNINNSININSLKIETYLFYTKKNRNKCALKKIFFY